MKNRFLHLVLALLLSLAFLGCTSRSTKYGKRESSVLGGLIKMERGAYGKVGPLTLPLRVSDYDPRADLDGDRLTLLFGLITIVDD